LLLWRPRQQEALPALVTAGRRLALDAQPGDRRPMASASAGWSAMRPDDLEQPLQARLDAPGPLPAPSCSTSLMLPGLRPCRPDRRVLELPGESHLRRTPDPTIWERRRRRGARPNGPTRQRGIESDSESVQGPGAPVL